MGQEILVLGMNRYRFTNKDTGEVIEGTKIIYVEGFDYAFNDINQKGVFPMNVSGSYELFDKSKEVPAYYEVEFRQRPDKNGKPISVPVDIKFSRQLESKIKAGVA